MPHILLVEDDDRLSKLIAKGFQEAEFEVTVAYDGATGLKLALQTQFDIVVTDIVLPKKNGLEFCNEIKVLKPNLPIIMLTALGTTDDKLEGFDAGADDYLTKPFEMRELVARIKVLLKRFSQQRQRKVFILKYEGIEMNLVQIPAKLYLKLIVFQTLGWIFLRRLLMQAISCLHRRRRWKFHS